ncbi:MAG: branched-chain amino acid transporter AzlC [Bacillales bacterium]|jgi:4-azaleucine resistance transporter AzlC|nr:branched-chain amino acid transporter AzlC [Bacillales bacterium]
MNQNQEVVISKQEILNRDIIDGFKKALPVIIGYIPIAITFGLIAKQSGLSIFELTMMSGLVFAGASQFMAVNMITIGSSSIEIIIATLILNLRHFIMTMSFSNLTTHLSKIKKLMIFTFVTDETYAISTLEDEKSSRSSAYYLTLVISTYLSWVLGSVAGGLIGDIIPEQLSVCMGISLYAMFISLLVPQVKKNSKLLIIIISSMFINIVLFNVLGKGWSIIASTISASFIGIFLFKDDE